MMTKQMRRWFRLAAASVIIVLLAGIGFVLTAMFVGVTSSAPNVREFYPNDEVYFIGSLRGSGEDQVSYYSVRCGRRGSPTSVISDQANLVLHLQGESYPVDEITPEVVQDVGGEVITPGYMDPSQNRLHGFLSWGPQNRDGGLEFYFEDGQLIEFYARWHKQSNCPFALSASTGPAFTFPVGEDTLISAYGEPVRRNDMRIH